MTSDPIDAARRALARGDILIAFDLAQAVLEEHPDDLDARYVLALSLARAGAMERAGREAVELQQRVVESGSAPAQLLEDADALVARLAKDEALGADGAERISLAGRAAGLYEAAAHRHRGSYSCVNAASLWLIAGDEPRARTLAERTLELVGSSDDQSSYWKLATVAEAALVLGDGPRARASLRAASAVQPPDHGARAATRRQLAQVCDAQGSDRTILDELEIPTALHYCGHVATGPPRVLEAVAEQVTDFLAERSIGFAYGSLASGSDITIAELLLDRSVDLHVVLPFALDEFVATSVASVEGEWVSRFHRCLDQATSVTYASDSAYAGDDELFNYAARIAMGHALNRASFLGTRAEQLAVWDGQPAHGKAGTAHDIETWRRSGHPGHVIVIEPRPPGAGAIPAGTERRIGGILFTDLRGFSGLCDEDFPAYVDSVLGALAGVIDDHGHALLGCNSWGDAVCAVFSDVTVAAHCALDLQRTISEVEASDTGLSLELAMRVGADAGPVLQLHDPVRDALTCFGRELTRAARIEPRTPEGEVYVTDAFAALLALEPDAGVRCEYVGRVTTAKGFETIPMYRLRHA